MTYLPEDLAYVAIHCAQCGGDPHLVGAYSRRVDAEARCFRDAVECGASPNDYAVIAVPVDREIDPIRATSKQSDIQYRDNDEEDTS